MRIYEIIKKHLEGVKISNDTFYSQTHTFTMGPIKLIGDLSSEHITKSYLPSDMFSPEEVDFDLFDYKIDNIEITFRGNYMDISDQEMAAIEHLIISKTE